MSLFSQRKAEPPDRYSYAIPEMVRSRILHTLQQHNAGRMSGGRYNFGRLLEEVGQQLLARTGGLQRPRETGQMFDHPVIAHFICCSDDEALDFIQFCFSADAMCGDSQDARMLVGAINRIFEEEGIGYELTPPTTIDLGPRNSFGRSSSGLRAIRSELPKVIRKDERTVHEKVVKPALASLRDPRLATANAELLDAFEKVRKQDYPAAITSCGKAFESVLKTICAIKGWPYDPNKDTCATLVEICRGQGLFFPFYAEIFKAVGTVRNKLGAHGGGPKPAYVPKQEHAEHMVAMTCAAHRIPRATSGLVNRNARA